jgi:hypothetical protein
MLVDAAYAAAAVRRFEHLVGFPDEAGQAALVRAFTEASRDASHCEGIARELERTLRFAPTPADVYEAGARLREPEEFDPKKPRCKHCGDTGWCEKHAGFATRCTCRAATEGSEPAKLPRPNQRTQAPLTDAGAAHPEVAIGIPPAVVTAKPPYKRKYAGMLGYAGPLTLAEAVESGQVTRSRAERLVLTWQLATGKQFAWLTVPEIPPKRIAAAAIESQPAAKQQEVS